MNRDFLFFSSDNILRKTIGNILKKRKQSTPFPLLCQKKNVSEGKR